MSMTGLNGLPVGVALAVRAEEFQAALASASWAVRQKGERRAHLFLLLSDRGRSHVAGNARRARGAGVALAAGQYRRDHRGRGGAQGFVLSMDDDFLIKTVANSAEALHLRRTTDRVALIAGEALRPHLDAIAGSCRAIVAELRTPGSRRRDADRLASAAAVPAAVAARRLA